MRILTRYMLWRMIGPLLLTVLLFTGLIWLLQALRLGHHILGAGLGPGLLGQLLLNSLPSLVIFAMPLALPVAILFTLGRMSREVLAMRLAGASPPQLTMPAAALSLCCAAATWLLAAHLETPALDRLHEDMFRGAARALILRAPPRRFLDLSGGATLHVGGRRDEGPDAARFERFFLAQQKPTRVVILAREARVRLVGRRVVMDLRHGELQMKNPDGGLRRVRFRALKKELDLGGALTAHLRFVKNIARGRRDVTAPLSCLALGLLAAVIGLSRGRLRMAAAGIIGVSLFQGGLWSVQVLWPGPAGALWGAVIVSGVVVGGAGVKLALAARA